MTSDNREIIGTISGTIAAMLKGEHVVPVKEPAEPDEEVGRMVSLVNELVADVNDCESFVSALARGDLGSPPPRSGMKVIDSFKSLQSNLQHLTWKTKRVAGGDFTQKIDFLGDFADAFNSMTSQLQDSFEKIEAQNIELRDARLEAERRAKEMDTVLDSIDDLIIIYDAAGNLVKTNKAFSRIAGPEEGRTRFMIRHPDGRPFAPEEQPEARALRGETVRDDTCRMTGDGGRELSFAVSSSPIVVEERISGAVVVYHDATERMRMEEALQISEQNLRKRNDVIESDLRVAQLIQHHFIPKRIVPGDHLRIDFRYYPLDAIGGDYFSITPLHEHGTGIFIGDVVGHGISAALFLSLLKSATDRVCRKYGTRPKEYMSALNRELIDYMNFNFITAVYGYFLYDESEGTTFTFANGGHPLPVLHRRAAGTVELINADGSMIGAIPDLEFEERRVSLDRGDRIFLYTDGIPEIRNKNGAMIGFENLPHLIRSVSQPDLGGTIDAIMREVYDFKGPMPIEDDIILIGLEVI